MTETPDEYVWVSDLYDYETTRWPSAEAVAEDWLADARVEPTYIGPAYYFIDAQMHLGTDEALALLDGLVSAARSRSELRHVGAGPLEDLLSHEGHGEAFLARIVARVLADERWATTISNVWLSDDVPERVRHRLAQLGARDFVAEHAMSKEEFSVYDADRQRKGFDLPEDRTPATD